MRAWMLVLALGACGGGQHAALQPTLQPNPKPPPPPAPKVAPVVSWDHLHGPIKSVAIHGGTDSDYVTVQPLFESLVGQPIDRAAIRSKLDAAMLQQTLADLRLSGEQVDGGVTLVINMVPQPTVVSLELHDPSGNVLPTPPSLSGQVGIPLAPITLDAGVQTMREVAEGDGHVAFNAVWHTSKQGDGVAVVVDVDAGDALLVATHEFKGIKHFKPAELDKALEGEVPLKKPWLSERVERAILLLEAFYYDRGYTEVAITVEPPPAHNPAPLIFNIHEGEQYHYKSVTIAGVDAAETRKLQPLVKLKAGDTFSRSAVIAAIGRLHEAEVKAHPSVQIDPITDVDKDKRQITIKLQVTLEPKT